jgi:hypothetical protein
METRMEIRLGVRPHTAQLDERGDEKRKTKESESFPFRGGFGRRSAPNIDSDRHKMQSDDKNEARTAPETFQFRGGFGQGKKSGLGNDHRKPFTQQRRGGFVRGGAPSAGYRRRTSRNKTLFSVHRLLSVDDAGELTLALTASMEAFEDVLNNEFLPVSEVLDVLQVVGVALSCQLYRESSDSVLQAVCTSRLLDLHLGSVIRYLQESGVAEGEMTSVVEKVLDLVSAVCHRRPSYASKVFLPMTVLSNSPVVSTALKAASPSLVDRMKTAMDDLDLCMKMLQGAAKDRERSGAFRRWRVNNEDEDVPPEDFFLLPILPEDRDMVWAEKPFLRSGFVFILHC